ncbi:hypothetical protein HY622_00435 [Candidatus Uhrbacteria bacterium]|nr:hypothetical protein [Candidatus Uhrbacteria bacterium]
MQAEAIVTVVIIDPEDELNALRDAIHKQLEEALPMPRFSEADRATFYAHAASKSALPMDLATNIRNNVEDIALLPILRAIWFLGVTSN